MLPQDQTSDSKGCKINDEYFRSPTSTTAVKRNLDRRFLLHGIFHILLVAPTWRLPSAILVATGRQKCVDSRTNDATP